MQVKELIRPIIPEWILRKKRQWHRYKAHRDCPEVSLHDVRASLTALDICEGDSLFVHTSLVHFERLKEPIGQLLELCQELVGPKGHILMPTFSYRPTLLTYLSNSPSYDPKRSPTVMGLLNEIFRRSPGTVRSLHPTHSVAARGPMSDWLTKDHLSKETPFHDQSPFARFEELDGKILFLGADHNANLTHVHVAEDILGSKFPVDTYHAALFPVTIKEREGQEKTVRIKAHNELVFRGHDLSIVTRDLQERGELNSKNIKNIKISLVAAKSVTQSVLRLASKGRTIYAEK